MLGPNCECCDKDLPPDSTEAYMCSDECTICHDCVVHRLANVCPNCGGGFSPRPIRPAIARRVGGSLHHQPASTARIHTPYTTAELSDWRDSVKAIKPEDR
ncbi:DUF1272 domain-containing protein [Amphritea sp. 1_MG-2023]|uniref:DUF1272 domain-containing protein n=1 Tax=Amphritea sp. 1_MG-2023 TaxID=3062670 RepID=UPI0026E37D55|nr:DUF1272 domain-containing protein [Amphritea sp. 1_MG-2023]MDO6562142.1 DUF1272 domain-containing protein [Amphritea sp. 1_MG-2023]